MPPKHLKYLILFAALAAGVALFAWPVPGAALT